MAMLAEEFGEDLDCVRKVRDLRLKFNIQDKSFNEKRSLPILIHALEQGKNIFNEDERKLILGELASESNE